MKTAEDFFEKNCITINGKRVLEKGTFMEFASQSKEDISCHCKEDHGTTTVECCNRCGKSVEPNWKVGPIDSKEESPVVYGLTLPELIKSMKDKNFREEVILEEVEKWLAKAPPSDSPRWVKASERNPDREKYYFTYRRENKGCPQITFWYADEQKWSSETYEWLDESKSEPPEEKSAY